MGKVVVVTGAGTGLGRALARRLARDGDNVVLLGRRLDKVQAVADELGASAMALACDIGDSASVGAAFDAIGAKHGRIDVLVNNAAVFFPFLIEEASDADFKAAIDTNLVGPLYCARAAIPLLRKSDGGLILSISSESVELDMPHLVLYQTTKAALERMTRGLRAELKGDGIRATVLRIGSLIDQDKQWDVDPAAFGRMAEAWMAVGINMMDKKSSDLSTIAGLVRSVIDLPRDTSLELVTLGGHAPL